jgi:catechol 2,3-dioxygenase-like lactoylglutathione lyase family enzyme
MRVSDIDATIDWYLKFTPLELLDRREDDGGYAAWLGHSDTGEFPFILVIAQLHDHSEPFESAPIATSEPLNHMGIEMPDRDGVDHVARRGEAAACLVMPATQMPDPIGYICMLHDPDGNMIEFSYDQGVYEKVRKKWGQRTASPP